MDNQTAFDYYLHTKRLAESTRKGIIKQVNAFHLWIEEQSIPDITEVSYNDVMAFVKHCTVANNVQKTIAIKLAFLNHYFTWLVKTGEMTDNPTSNIRIQGIKRRKLHHLLKREQLDGLHQSFSATGIAGMRNKVILGMVVYQALRVEELTTLTIKDLKLKEGKVQVKAGRKTNGRNLTLESHQVVDLLDYMSDSRKVLLQETGKQTDLLFISGGSGERLNNTLQYLLSQLKQQSKLIVDWKQVRASVISGWITVHGLRNAQYLAGHRYVSSTEEYRQQNIDELKGNIEQFHPL